MSDLELQPMLNVRSLCQRRRKDIGRVTSSMTVVIDRSFVNCPRLRHSSKFSLLNFQGLTNGRVIALSRVRSFKRDQMLRIQRDANGQVVLRISGRLDAEDLPELKELIQSEGSGRRIVLDLRELTLVDQEAVRFLEQLDSNGIELQNCAPYISEWMERQRDGK
jgi:STAS domain-containing protein